MAQQTVNVGSSANDGTGDAIRAAFQKLNANDAELYEAVAEKLDGDAVDTDSTMAANSDSKVPSQKATKAALATKLTPLAFRASMTTTASQTISPDTSTAITIDTEQLDPGGIHAGGEVTPGFIGVFNFKAHIWLQSGLTAGTVCYWEIWSKPTAGGSYSLFLQVPFLPSATAGIFDFDEFISVDSATRVFQMRLYLQGSGDKTLSGSGYSSISGQRVS